jgi:Peptidase M15
MNSTQARKWLFLSIVGVFFIIFVSRARAGKWPEPKTLLALGIFYLIAGMMVSAAPAVGASLAILIFVGMFLDKGTPVFQGIGKAVKKGGAKPETDLRISSATKAAIESVVGGMPFIGGGSGQLQALPVECTYGRLIRIDSQFVPVTVQICREFNVKVTSGYRSPALNRSVDGAPKSDHLCGYAGDFSGKWGNMARLAKWARQQPFAYVEFATPDHMDHVHISFARCP